MANTTSKGIQFKAKIEKFNAMGEKTGWTYIRIAASLAQKLKPNNKKSFRVKGKLDEYEYSGLALIPMGEGDFILALKQELRKKIGKQKGDSVLVRMEIDPKEPGMHKALMDCLKEEPEAMTHFLTFPKSHQLYFNNWVKSAKTIETQSKRIALVVNAMLKKQDYGQMIRAEKARRADQAGLR